MKATIADPKDTLLIINIPRGWEEADLVKALTDVSLVKFIHLELLFVLKY